jgi:hypothetical protein
MPVDKNDEVFFVQPKTKRKMDEGDSVIEHIKLIQQQLDRMEALKGNTVKKSRMKESYADEEVAQLEKRLRYIEQSRTLLEIKDKEHLLQQEKLISDARNEKAKLDLRINEMSNEEQRQTS